MSIPLLPSFRRQQLVLDFSSLSQTCPDGLYLTITPDQPSLWTGVLFIRAGPYASAVLRFTLSFPQNYPELPPLVTFSTEIFHPLVVPLTTYTFSTGILDPSGTVSASDDERLPPGAFSLRHGFPHWFGRRTSFGGSIGSVEGLGIRDAAITPNSPAITAQQIDTNVGAGIVDTRATTIEVLKYIKTAFDDESLLDSLPIQAAGNPSAWHAWRAYRGLIRTQQRGRSPAGNGHADPPASPRRPGEWNWDGVWESRVHEGIENSINEATLYNSNGSIRFTKLDDEQRADIGRSMSNTQTD